MPIQQMLLGAGSAVATKTYVDDVFSTYLYEGNNSTLAISNGLDLATEGGMIWVKNRDSARDHCIVDTERGIGKRIETNKYDAQDVYVTTKNISSFTSTGFTLGQDEGHDEFNKNGDNYTSWTFRKAPGFFTISSWTGNGANRLISHDLGSVPGCILIKCTSTGFNWMVYHRGSNGGVNPADYGLRLNDTNAQTDNSAYFNDTLPTSTHFTIGTNAQVNSSGATYVAYVFAGGESTAATARSVDFDGSGDYLSLTNSTDFDFGSSNFTIEFWVKPKAATGSMGIVAKRSAGGAANTNFVIYLWDRKIRMWFSDGSSYFVDALETSAACTNGAWNHCAIVRNGSTFTIYVNGIASASATSSTAVASTSLPLYIGCDHPGNAELNAYISNLRIVKGTAVYTSSFKPPTAPLTNITNTKLLCCNNSSTTGSTVTPGTITANGDPTASTDSPFDDPAGFSFGDAGDQNVIKCGSFTTNSDQYAVIDLGYEPQWILIKRTSASDDWIIVDSMRGLPNAQDTEADTGSGTKQLDANTDDSEVGNNRVGITSTGFRFDNYGANASFVYVALRRPDGYVGKPPELGTGVFAMDTGNGTGTIPSYDSGFPVDWVLAKKPASTGEFHSIARLTGTNYMFTSSTAAETAYANFTMDSNLGWSKGQETSSNQSWMWKRHAGLDVVAYKGNSVSASNGGHSIAQSLSKTPEMIWIKDRDQASNWHVFHKDLTGNNILILNSTAGTSGTGGDSDDFVSVSSTHFTIGSENAINNSARNYIAMLFASTAVSKVGTYTGDDSDDGSHVIDVGFTPRFLIIKRADNSADWKVYDTTNGFPTSGTANYLELNTTDARYSGSGISVTQTTNGFKLWSPGSPYNANNAKYIYYAHA